MRNAVCFRWFGLLMAAFVLSAPMLAQKGAPSPKDQYEKPRPTLIVEPVNVGPRNPALYVPYNRGDFSPASGDQVVVDVTGTPSYDSAGAACNIRMTIPAPAGRDNFNGIGWDVQLTANAPSWRCEIAILITNVNGQGYILRPGAADCSAGTGFYTSGGVGKLCDVYGLPDLPLPDGNLYLEFYETYNDFPDCGQDGNWDSGSVTFQFGTTPPFTGWDETINGGDAGDLPATAQKVSRPEATPCVTAVTRISGNRADPSDADMYIICITDPASFSATTVGGAGFDTQLWLFRCDGTGVVANDDYTGLQSQIDNTPGCITESGTYLLAITRFNRDAVDANGNLLWSSGALSCADNTNPLAGWTGTTSAAGIYAIQLQGAYFVSPQGCEQPPGCEGDVNGDGRTDDADLLLVLFAFGNFCPGCPEDLNGDSFVDDADLLIVLFNFGCGG